MDQEGKVQQINVPNEIDLPDNGKPKLSEEQLISQKEVGESYWSLVKHQFKKNKLAVISIYIVLFLIFVAIFYK